MSTQTDPILKQEPPLKEFTEDVRKNIAITWYRTKLTKEQIKEVHQKSDLKGAIQTFGFLAILIGAGVAAWFSFNHWPWWATVGIVFLYGMVGAFTINGVHELGHGTVFKTRWLNSFFCHLLAFLGWHNHETFQYSHIRHHRYTLHPPDDLEVVLPSGFLFRDVLKWGFFFPLHFKFIFLQTLRYARGEFRGEWELTLYPESDPKSRKAPVRWARITLAGHALISVAALTAGQWIIPILCCSAGSIGQWLFFLCNNTQHTGLKDNVDDFRLCCRTFTIHPIISFLYWQMNYHIEHHMYAAVPCYNLGKLHKLIKHELPPTPHGLIATWKEIDETVRRQRTDPTYQYEALLPDAT